MNIKWNDTKQIFSAHAVIAALCAAGLFLFQFPLHAGVFDLSSVEKAQAFIMNIPAELSGEDVLRIVYDGKGADIMIDYEKKQVIVRESFLRMTKIIKDKFPDKVLSVTDDEIKFRITGPDKKTGTFIKMNPFSIVLQIRSFKNGDMKLLKTEKRGAIVSTRLLVRGEEKSIDYMLENGGYRIFLPSEELMRIEYSAKVLSEVTSIFDSYTGRFSKNLVNDDNFDKTIFECIEVYLKTADAPNG